METATNGSLQVNNVALYSVADVSQHAKPANAGIQWEEGMRQVETPANSQRDENDSKDMVWPRQAHD